MSTARLVSTVAFVIGVYVVSFGVFVGALVALDFVVRTVKRKVGRP